VDNKAFQKIYTLTFVTMHIETNLDTIGILSNQKEKENDRFVNFLKEIDGDEVDEQVFALNNVIAPQINCTTCGNCCKSLMVNINDEEADNLSAHLQMPRKIFDEKFIERGSSMMILNSIPCHFLVENKCSVYEYRFEGCKEFPALHLPLFNRRLFTVFMHYGRCPIIFNVVEALKERLDFEL